MALSLFVARVATLLYLSAAVAMLRGKINQQKMFKSFSESPGLMMMSGLMAIVSGLIIVQYHNLWVKDWRVLVTIIGWISLLKGVLFIAYPEFLVAFKPLFKDLRKWGYLCLAIGLFFGYFGFVA